MFDTPILSAPCIVMLDEVNQYNTVKTVCNEHPRDPEIVTTVDRWSLFRGLWFKSSHQNTCDY
jgi:hypothetical protein